VNWLNEGGRGLKSTDSNFGMLNVALQMPNMVHLLISQVMMENGNTG
jgi:hypothetical protein